MNPSEDLIYATESFGLGKEKSEFDRSAARLGRKRDELGP